MMYDSMTSGPNRSCASRMVAKTSKVLRRRPRSAACPELDSGRRPASSSASSLVRSARVSAA